MTIYFHGIGGLIHCAKWLKPSLSTKKQFVGDLIILEGRVTIDVYQP